MIILDRKMEDWESRVRANIKTRLERRGAQAALARQLTTHDQAWLSRYITGQFSMDVGTLQEICTAWNLTLTDLMGDAAPLTAEQVEAQEVAALWPTLSPTMRQAIRLLIQPPRATRRASGDTRVIDPPVVPASTHGRRRQ